MLDEEIFNYDFKRKVLIDVLMKWKGNLLNDLAPITTPALRQALHVEVMTYLTLKNTLQSLQ